MTTLLHDLRLAFRLLARNPAFTLIVVVTLGLGIGLNTAVFSAIDALLLRPLPGVRAADQLVQVYRSWPGGAIYNSNSIPHYFDVRDRSHEVFSDVGLWGFLPMNLSVDGKPTRIFGEVASANMFDVFGARAAMGRTFVAAEDSGRGAHPVVVLSHPGWVKLFGADPGVIGKSVIVDGQSYQVVGVTAPEFKGGFTILTPVLWVPLTQLDQLNPESHQWDRRGNNSFNMIARMKPGIGIERVRQRMTGIVDELRRIYPDDYKENGINLVLQSDAGIHPMFKSAQVGLSAVIMGVVILLLLLACVNVANLMLARARDRAREMAVRLSLGAERRVLIRQLLTESIVLATLGGAAGLVIAAWAMRIANHAISTLPTEVEITPDLAISPTVLLSTLAVSLLTGVAFGLAPALQATRPALIPALKGEAPAGGSRSRMSRGLVVAQVALSILLLISAGLFLRSLEAATTVDKGFVSDNLLVADLDPGLQGYTRPRTEDFYRRLRERLEALPGVKGVGFGDHVPLSLNTSDWGVTIPGYTPSPNESMSILMSTVTPGYFEAIGTPLLKGRGFLAQDDSAAAPAIVINQRFGERFWPGQDPIGRTVRVSGKDHTVIGVTRTGKYSRLGENPTAYMYVAQAQHWTAGMSIMIRTSGDPQRLDAAVRREVRGLDPDLPISAAQTMDNRLALALLPARLAASVLGIFGLLGLVLASLGVYGVMSHTVAQRSREIGIRLAIGAAGGAVVRLLLRDGLRLVVAGTVIGLAAAVLGARLLRGVLYGAGLDPLTFAAVPVILGSVAVLAVWIPARRAAGVNPVVVLRQD